jgi:hypothetical protein
VSRSRRLPRDQAEIVFSDEFVEQLAEFDRHQQLDVLVTVVALCSAPEGKHALAGAMAGWNTVEVLARKQRVVFKVSIIDGVGLIEVLCMGERSKSVVYDVALALIRSGALSDDEVTQIWQALALLDTLAEEVGLDGWDYRPPPAPDGMVRSAIAAGVVDADLAPLLSADELTAALSFGYGPDGPDAMRGLLAALERARARVPFTSAADLLARRGEQRCNAYMPRARTLCIRIEGHPGPHRAR